MRRDALFRPRRIAPPSRTLASNSSNIRFFIPEFPFDEREPLRPPAASECHRRTHDKFPGAASGSICQAIMNNTTTLAQAFDEILDFLAAGTTAETIAKFRPSEAAQVRVQELVERRDEGQITPAESEELEEYLRLEHLMIMA